MYFMFSSKFSWRKLAAAIMAVSSVSCRRFILLVCNRVCFSSHYYISISCLFEAGPIVGPALCVVVMSAGGLFRSVVSSSNLKQAQLLGLHYV